MIRKTLGLLMLLAPAAVCVAACGDDDPVDKYPSTDAFCAAVADTECKDTAGKCAVTPDACKNARKAACLDASSRATGQGRGYTSARVDACLAATTAAYNEPTSKAKLDARNDACARVFAGAKNKSEPCANEYDCSGSLVCDLQKGFCADKTARKEADACNNAGDICDDGLFCDGPAGSRFCRKARALGEACNAETPCIDTAFCNGTTCIAIAQTGQPCTDDDQCASTYCNPTANACGTRLYPSESGTCKDFGGT
ncbi:MAG: hypothetical protein KIT84_23680 [Labilithrix sp.]|nr:hypothetical protein [Labilithrix sp.]MCW5814049.1 hypothetical protein [Labilithrix sp.]